MLLNTCSKICVFLKEFNTFYISGIAVNNDNIIVREVTLHNFIMLIRLGERPETCNKS